MNYAAVRVLLVDDFGLARERTRRSLINLGFAAANIDDAANGVEALASLRRAADLGLAYDLIISDWNMPEMTGVELVKACRGDQNLRGVKIMIVSSESEKASIIEALKAGANEYGPKPLSDADLAKKIAGLLGAA